MEVRAHPFSEEDIMAYLDGESAIEEAKGIEEHLAECGECRGVVEDLKHVSRGMQQWRVPAVSAGWRAPVVKKKGIAKVWRWTAAVAAVAGALFIALPGTKQMAVPPGTMVLHQRMSEGLQTEKLALQRVPDDDIWLLQSNAKPLIARESEITVTVEHLDVARAAMDGLVQKYGGYVADLSMNGSGEGRSLTATLQVPAQWPGKVFAGLRALGTVARESQRNEDVTRQSVDTDAKLVNLREEEQRLKSVLKEQTGKLADVLQVEEEISRVRGEIETTESEQKALAKRVEMTAIHITMTERLRKQALLNDGSLATRLRNAAVDGFESLTGLLEGVVVLALAYGPVVLVIAAALFWPGRWAWKRLRDTA